MRILSGLILTNGSRGMRHDGVESNENTDRTNSHEVDAGTRCDEMASNENIDRVYSYEGRREM